MLPEQIEKTATRNMFYDEKGKHVRTKKEILDENGNVRKGCKIVKKGEVYERNLFTAKNKLFKQDDFVYEVKHFYTDLINMLVKANKKKLHVFDENGLYLATKKIGKNNPKDEQIQTDNGYRMRWNCGVDKAIVSGVADTARNTKTRACSKTAERNTKQAEDTAKACYDSRSRRISEAA